MQPTRYEIEYNGRWTTVRTCGGPVGAFHGLTGERPTNWVYLNDRETLVNGCMVRAIN